MYWFVKDLHTFMTDDLSSVGSVLRVSRFRWLSDHFSHLIKNAEIGQETRNPNSIPYEVTSPFGQPIQYKFAHKTCWQKQYVIIIHTLAPIRQTRGRRVNGIPVELQ